MTVSLNLRLIPKMIRNGVIGGSSQNLYLKDNKREIKMNLIFPKGYWQLEDKGDYLVLNLQNYTFTGSKLYREYSLEEKVEMQKQNVVKAKERVKTDEKLFKSATVPKAVIATTANLKLSKANLEKQQKHLKSLQRQSRAKKKKEDSTDG
jgi:hypothetical protein